jgi:uncharacterized membrane protein (UPF0127 family)
MPNKDIAKTALAPSRFRQFAQYLALLIVVIVFGVGIYFFTAINSPEQRSVAISSETFKLEVASSDEARVQGLSGRNNLRQNTGMLFDFGQLGNWQIWMKDMRFNIDILWLDESGKVVGVKTDASPATYPQTFGAVNRNRYVIELPAGTAERLSIKTNDVIQIN